MINEFARFPTRLDNVYFANNEQASNLKTFKTSGDYLLTVKLNF